MSSPKVPSLKRKARRAFTLVELVVVVLILGILAGVAAPRFLDVAGDSNEAVAAASVLEIAELIDLATARQGELPAKIDPLWFQSGRLPESPYNTFGLPAFEVVNEPGEDHPTDIAISATSGGAYWYNAANGDVRIRVPAKSSRAETIDLYNRVNYDAETLTQSALPSIPPVIPAPIL